MESVWGKFAVEFTMVLRKLSHKNLKNIISQLPFHDAATAAQS